MITLSRLNVNVVSFGSVVVLFNKGIKIRKVIKRLFSCEGEFGARVFDIQTGEKLFGARNNVVAGGRTRNLSPCPFRRIYISLFVNGLLPFLE